MVWRHYEIRGRGTVSVLGDDGVAIDATYNSGLVATGKTRVFAGYFVRLTLPSGTEFLGEDEHSLRSALLRLASNMSAVKLAPQCAGLDPRWRESALSENSGFGYFVFHPEPVHMMDPTPSALGANDTDIEAEIREAVEGMRIGLAPR
ncbi:hypothetical protein [Sphingomonas lacusdianchii]|uniref:hypothetical protein n=1 Tax=Sphingomonas lacusdianchii TaxID=2917992 RepID=UPI001F5A104C|nr:hypothetical protein [Sphingomonas sp. JXJ CY 53]